MRIDCRNLECPQPVIRTKEAIQSLKIGEELRVVVNSLAPLENIKKFLNANEYAFDIAKSGDECEFCLVKNKELTQSEVGSFSCEARKPKIVYLKDDKAGDEPIGKGLLAKFLGALLSMDATKRPKIIICVNGAVRITTDRAHPSFAVLKELESAGVRVLSCGSCLEALKLVDRLSIGEISNAFEIMNLIMESDTVSL